MKEFMVGLHTTSFQLVVLRAELLQRNQSFQLLPLVCETCLRVLSVGIQGKQKSSGFCKDMEKEERRSVLVIFARLQQKLLISS